MAGITPQDAITLAAEIRAELNELDEAVAEISSLRTSAEKSAPPALALLLHNYYTGVESIFVRVTKIFGGASSDTGKWHRQLLENMSLELPTIPPPVITPETREQLGTLLAFRHIVRNLYSWRLDKTRLDEIASEVPATHAAVRTDLVAFNDFLHQLAQAAP
jgi:hypothetical protein